MHAGHNQLGGSGSAFKRNVGVRRASAVDSLSPISRQLNQRVDQRVTQIANTANKDKRREGQTVNPSAYAYRGSNPLPATLIRPPFEGA